MKTIPSSSLLNPSAAHTKHVKGEGGRGRGKGWQDLLTPLLLHLLPSPPLPSFRTSVHLHPYYLQFLSLHNNVEVLYFHDSFLSFLPFFPSPSPQSRLALHPFPNHSLPSQQIPTRRKHLSLFNIPGTYCCDTREAGVEATTPPAAAPSIACSRTGLGSPRFQLKSSRRGQLHSRIPEIEQLKAWASMSELHDPMSLVTLRCTPGCTPTKYMKLQPEPKLITTQNGSV